MLLPDTGVVAAVAALVLTAVLLAPALVIAQAIDLVTHADDPDNSYWGSVLGAGSGGCSACHTLKPGGAETGTSLITKNARTISDIKNFNSGVAPAKLGCTFCHDRLTASTKMKGVLGYFTGGKVSQHPVGRRFTGTGAYDDTNSEYLSSYRSNTAGEMDCLDCHDQALVAPWSSTEGISCKDAGDPDDAANAGCYMQHRAPPANNPYLLKNVTVAGKYDDLCRSCHGAAAASDWKGKGKDIRLTSHSEGANDGTNPLQEADGTLLLTSDPGKDGTADALTGQCTGCHSVHSSGNAKLFVSAYGNGAACTTCHLAGDRFDNYTKHGHGKPTAVYQQAGQTIPLNRPCTSCHFALDVTTPNSAGTRKPHAEKSPAGSLQVIYQKKFNLSTAPLPGDAGSATGNPEWGICVGCHSLSKYKAHQSAEGTKSGCQDCHDEHAEGAGGAGATPNIFMISLKSKKNGSYTTVDPARSRSGAEDVVYTQQRFQTDGVTPRTGVSFDFYRADGKGFCDNTECHGTSNSATVPGPLTQLMGSVGDSNHSMGYFAPGVDCYNCHTHKDPGGGFRATASCDECHLSSDPAVNATEIVRSHLSANESVATHGAHTTSILVGDCDACHPHNGKTVAPGDGVHMNGNVEFGGTMMPETGLSYTGSSFGGGACLGTANACHDAEAGEWKSGLNANGDACADCHAATGKLLGQEPTSGLHAVTAITRHDGTLLSGNCVNCHEAAGPSSAHLNGTLNTPSNAAFSFHPNVVSYASAAGCQAAALCHGGGDAGTWRRRWVGVVDAVPGTAGNETPGRAVCQNCHGDSSGWRWDEANAATTDHTDPYPGNTGDRMGEHAVCQTCHGWGGAAYGRAWRTGNHGNGSIEMNGPDATHGTAAGAQYNDDSGGCMAACHASQFGLRTTSGWPPAYGDFGTGN